MQDRASCVSLLYVDSMCLIVFNYAPDDRKKLIVVANRDEFLGRPTQQAHFWEDQPGLLAGRDLKEGGTWLGIHTSGRFAAVTNYREVPFSIDGAISRGNLVVDFLAGNQSSMEYLTDLQTRFDQYNGVNVVVYDGAELGYASNRSASPPILLPPGLYGLSNHLLDTPWPKVELAKERLRQILDAPCSSEALGANMDLLNVLEDETEAADHLLPKTGVSLELERKLSAMTIKMPDYGTRSTTVVTLFSNQELRLVEKTLSTQTNTSKSDDSVVQYHIEPRTESEPF